MIKKNKTKFIILSTQRSGSTLLRMYLNSHPNIRCHDEVFLKKYGAKDGFNYFLKRSSIRSLKYYSGFSQSILDEYFDNLLYNPKTCAPFTENNIYKDWEEFFQIKNYKSERAVGIKVMYNNLEPLGLDLIEFTPEIFKSIFGKVNFKLALKRYILSNEFKIIHLIRSNPLKVVLSSLVRKERKIAHSTQAINKVTIKVNVESIIQKVERILKSQKRFSELVNKKSFLEVNYEFFIRNVNEVTLRIMKFLNINNIQGFNFPALRKMNPDSIKEIVINYNDLKSELIKKNLGHFLD